MLSKFAISCYPSPASWLLHFPLALSIEIERHFKQCGLLAAEGREGIDPAHPGELWQMEETANCCRTICQAYLNCLFYLSSGVSMQKNREELRLWSSRGGLEVECVTPGWFLHQRGGQGPT